MCAAEGSDPESVGLAGPAAPPSPSPASAAESTTERREGVVLLLSLCRFAEALAVGMLVPILPVFVGEVSAPGLERSTEWIEHSIPWLARSLPTILAPDQSALTAFLFFLTGLSLSFSQIVAGRLSDRLDLRKPFILVGMAGGAICSAWFAGIDSYAGLLISRVIQGLFLGLTFPPMMAIVARHTAPGRGGRVLGMYTTIRLLGFALGPLVGGVIADLGGPRSAFFGSAALLLISVALVGWLVPDPREGPRRTRAERAARPGVPWEFRHLGVCIFMMMVGISAVISLFPTYQHELGATKSELGIIFSAFIGTRSLLQWPAGWIGDRFDKKYVLVGSLIALAPMIWLQGLADTIGEVVAVRSGLGAVSAAVTASVSGISAERSLPGNRARVMGINTLCFSLGTALGPLLTGFIPDRAIAFTVPAVATVLWAGLIAAMIPGDRSLRQRASAESAPVAPNPQRITPA
jgi:MFS family permease